VRLLVTGGAGFIGSNFVHQTVREHPEVEVTVLDALTYAGDEKSLAPVEDAITFAKGDITDADLVDELVRDADIVVHFAAVRWTARTIESGRRRASSPARHTYSPTTPVATS
jgi:dTDP-glucose 4,6-dehydratase